MTAAGTAPTYLGPATATMGKVYYATSSGSINSLAKASLEDVVVTSAPSVKAIDASGSTLAWLLASGEVYQKSLGLSNSTQRPVGKVDAVATGASLGIVGDVVLVTDGTSNVYRFASGAGSSPLAQGQAKPSGVTAQGAYVYWANAGDGTIMAKKVP